METVAVDRNEAPPPTLSLAADVLHGGRLVVAPTETSYMLGALATDARAIARVMELKGRRVEKPFPVVVADLAMARRWGALSREAEHLAERFWPGPLTLLVPLAREGLHLGRAPVDGVAMRVPGARLVRELSGLVGEPLISTSANASGGPEPYSIDEVRGQLGLPRDEVGLIIDAGRLPRVRPSTIVDLRRAEPRVLREGSITTKELWD